jgi:hypothetical protein
MSFVLLSLAVFRLTHLLVYDYGPFHVFERIRAFVGIVELPMGVEYRGQVAELFGCHWCMSIWWAAIGAIVVYGFTVDGLFAWLAASGASSLLEELVQSLGED